jgi:hypothetical protein
MLAGRAGARGVAHGASVEQIQDDSLALGRLPEMGIGAVVRCVDAYEDLTRPILAIDRHHGDC